MSRDSIQDLTRAARAGEPGAEAKLFNCVAEGLLLYIRLRLGPALRQELESLDILQEAFLVAHEKALEFEDRGPGSYVAWLCRIAENRIRRHIEYRGAEKRRPKERSAAYAAVIDRLRASAAGPLTEAMASERRSRLIAALDQEDEETRSLVLARFFADQSFDEIATETGRSPSTVRRLLAQAATRIGAALRDLEEPS